MRTYRFATLLLFGLAASLAAESELANDTNHDGTPDSWVAHEDGTIRTMEADRNYDGLIDFRATYDDRGRRIYEEYDFNYDGEMDDFYFFEAGALVRQEIDSNFDRRIDIRVYVVDGIYIGRYEWDTDYDGSADKIADFLE